MPERDQSYEGPPFFSSFIQNSLRWMENQLKTFQQPPQVRQGWVRKDEDTHPSRGSGPT
jgi:hypothetical protein